MRCGNWCLENGKCSKQFPKSFNSETTLDENGYPQYRRRNTGVSYEKFDGFTVDNRYVVPYSPKLSLIFNCHINCRSCNEHKVSQIFIQIYLQRSRCSISCNW